MKFTINQIAFTLPNRFEILDKNQEIIYTAERELFKFLKECYLYDTNGQVVASYKQRFKLILPSFIVTIQNSTFTIDSEFTFIDGKYRIDGLNWVIWGSSLNHKFEIMDGDRMIATIDREWFRFVDHYEVDLLDEKEMLRVIMIILVIDEIMQQNNVAATSTSNS